MGAKAERSPAPKLTFYSVVSTSQGRTFPALSRAQVEERLERGELDGQDLIGEPGATRVPLQDHPLFAAWFRPGSDAFERRARAKPPTQTARAASPRTPPPRRRPWALGAAALLGLALVITVAASLRSGERAQAQGPLPGDALIVELQERWSGTPVDAEQRLELAWIGLQQGTSAGWGAARRELEAAVAADPTQVEVLAPLALTYARLARGDAAYGRKAVQLQERVAALGEGTQAQERLKVGLVLFSGGDAEVALQRAQACADAYPGDGVCRWFLGQALVELGRFEEAKAELAAASDALGGAAVVRLALRGIAHLRSLDFAAAEAVLAEYRDTYPDHADTHLLLSELYRRTGRLEEALLAAREAARVEPKHFEARRAAAALELSVAGDGAAALEHYSSLLSELSEHPGLRSELSVYATRAALLAGESERAYGLARRMARDRPGWAPAQLALAQAAGARGELQAVERALLAADVGGLPPDQARAFHLATAGLYARLGQPRAATLALETAKSSDAVTLAQHLMEAQQHLALGQEELAVEAILESWHLDPLVDADAEGAIEITYEDVDLDALEAGLRAATPHGSPLERRFELAMAGLGAVRCARSGEGCAETERRLKRSREFGPPRAAWLALTRLELGAGEVIDPLSVAMSGHEGEPYFAALWAWALLSDPERREPALLQARRLAQEDAVALGRVARLYAALGREEEATPLLQRGLHLAPWRGSLGATLIDAQRGPTPRSEGEGGR